MLLLSACVPTHADACSTDGTRERARGGCGVGVRAHSRIRIYDTAIRRNCRSALNDNAADIDTWGRAVRCSDCRGTCLRVAHYMYAARVLDLEYIHV